MAALKRESAGLCIVNMLCSSSMKDALEIMRQFKTDVVLMSIYITDGDAVTLMKSKRKDDLPKETLFMLISSESCFEMPDLISQAGVVAILPRPFTQQSLEHAFRLMCDYLSG